MLLWLGVIFMFSSQPYEDQNIQPLLKHHISKDTASRILPDITIHYGPGQIKGKSNPYGFMEFLFRKSAHLFMYGVLGVFAYLGFSKLGFDRWKRPAGAILVVFCAAAADEWNQYYRPNRTGTWLDVGVDLVGGCLGILLLVLLQKAVRKLRT